MDRKGHMPEYNITDDILNAVAEVVEKSTFRGGENLCVGYQDMLEPNADQGEVPVYRQKGAGVFAGEHLLCRAPMPQYVEELMQELEDWLKESHAHPLIKAGMLLYQYIMIQPFEGDNTCYGIKRAAELLKNRKTSLQVPDLSDDLHREGFIKALEQCDLYGEAGPFLLYFLQSLIVVPLTDFRPQATLQTQLKEGDEKVERLLTCMGEGAYTTRELMELLQLKHRPTFRDNYLLPAMERGLVEMTIPDKPNSSQQRYRKVR